MRRTPHPSLREHGSKACTCETVEPRRLLSAAVVLVDSNPGPASTSSYYLGNLNHLAFFLTHHESQPLRLWSSDGTPEGTQLVVQPPPGMSIDTKSCQFNGELLFFQRTAFEAYGLFATNGTAAGTRLIREFDTASGDSGSDFVVEVGVAYFGIGEHIWRTDGTTQGTVIAVPAPANASVWARWEGNFYYFGITEVGLAFYRSDGTVAGTELLKQFTLPNEDYGRALIPAYGKLYLSIGPGWNDAFWSSDGTAAGTRLVEPMPPENICNRPRDLHLVGEELHFWAYDRTVYPNYSVRREWVLPANHQMHFAPEPPAHEAYGRVVIGGDVFSASSQDLYYNGTVIAQGIEPRNLTAVAGKLVFKGSDPAHGQELWTSDGTPAGTRLADDIMPGPQSSWPHMYSVVSNKAIFVAPTPEFGAEFMAYAVPVPPGQPPAPRQFVPRGPFGTVRLDVTNDGSHGRISRALALLDFGDDAGHQ